jgi:hypothetical protein
MPLGGLCEKTALAGGLALAGAKAFGSKALSSGAGQFAYNFARSKVPLVGGLIGQSGTGLASTLGFNASHIKDSFKDPAGSFKMTTSQPAFKPQSTVKLSASLSETLSLGGLTKRANDDPAWHRAANAAGYGAFLLPYLSDRIHDNQDLTTALNAFGLATLGLTSADKVRHGDSMSLYDVGGLGVMGAGMLHSALRPQQAH